MIKATCTWGDGPDILLSNEGKGYVLHEPLEIAGWKNGVSRKGSIALNIEEAKQLVGSLMTAISSVEELESIAESEDSKENEDGSTVSTETF